ncbi:serine/threonine protein kinase [Bacillus sp. TS-2]|nr:serine/threonine protein kinase [Bacillus sp. TS-2]
MKSNSLKNHVDRLSAGYLIIGKWHKHRYTIVRKLGSGATGTVYLAEDGLSQLVALKVALDNMAITSEVNVLKHLSKVEGKILGPKLIDVDDLVTSDGNLPFYVMEYLKGTSIIDYVNGKGAEWLGLFAVQLLGDLENLHREGWVFGDLKPDNLLIVGSPKRIRWIDVGGTTLLGRSIKEFTEFFDRGYWNLGSRKAEPSYDLFAVAMIMINCEYPERFEKRAGNLEELFQKKIMESQRLQPFCSILMKAIRGNYTRAGEMKSELIQLLGEPPKGKKKISVVKQTNKSRKVKKRSQKKPSFLIEFFLILSLLILCYILYLFGQMM